MYFTHGESELRAFINRPATLNSVCAISDCSTTENFVDMISLALRKPAPDGVALNDGRARPQG